MVTLVTLGMLMMNVSFLKAAGARGHAPCVVARVSTSFLKGGHEKGRFAVVAVDLFGQRRNFARPLELFHVSPGSRARRPSSRALLRGSRARRPSSRALLPGQPCSPPFEPCAAPGQPCSLPFEPCAAPPAAVL